HHSRDVDQDDSGSLGGDRGLDGLDAQFHGGALHIGEPRPTARVNHRGGGGEEGVGGHHYFALLHVERPEHDFKGTRAALHRHGKASADDARKGGFEGLAILAEGQGASSERFVDASQDLASVFFRDDDPGSWNRVHVTMPVPSTLAIGFGVSFMSPLSAACMALSRRPLQHSIAFSTWAASARTEFLA